MFFQIDRTARIHPLNCRMLWGCSGKCGLVMLLLVVLFVAPLLAIAQPGQGTNNCDPSSNSIWTTGYANQSFYVPWPTGHVNFGNNRVPGVTKTLHVNIHVWQYSEAEHRSFEDTPLARLRLAAAIDYVDSLLRNSELPSDPIFGPEWYFTGSRIGVELDSIYFHIDSIANKKYANNSNRYLDTAANALVPGNERFLNLHIVHGSTNGAGGFSPGASLNDFDAVGRITSVPLSDGIVGGPPSINQFSGHWAHEIGHVLGLLHTYHRGFTGDDQEETCYDFLNLLYDVFPDQSSNQWCTVAGEVGPSPTCGICRLDPSCSMPWNSPNDGCTNNLMGNNTDHRFVSPYQMGRMHRTLMTTSTSQYATGYENVDLEITQSETWDWRMKVYSNIVIKLGATLTINCELHMVPDAKIIVEPGARLIIDGGWITSPRHETRRWAGIQVQGLDGVGQESTQGTPYLEQQGLVILQNGGVIENADLGIGMVDAFGSSFGGGGVVIIDGTPTEPAGYFINCRAGIRFNPYYPASPVANASILRGIRFEQNGQNFER